MFGLLWKAVLGVFVAMAAIPIGTRDLDRSRAHPAEEYANAMMQYRRLADAETTQVGLPGRSVLLTHGAPTPHVVVLLHGLTNSPRQFRIMGDALYACGYNVFIPRLPLHGYRTLSVSALGRLTAEQYQHFADSVVDLARGLGDTIVVVGLSAGGTTAAWIAQHRGDVHRVVVIAPALSIRRIPPVIRPPATNLFSRLPNLTLFNAGDTVRYVYRGISTRGVAQTLRFGKAVYDEAGRAPPAVRSLVLITNDNDHTIDNGRARSLARRWRAHGVPVPELRLSDTLQLPHDVMDVEEVQGRPDVVYPLILRALEGDTSGTSAARCHIQWPPPDRRPDSR